MSTMQLTETLFQAHSGQATGWVMFTSHGKRSRMGFHRGQLVRLEVDFGFQAPAQALLQSGQLAPLQLDALWARGEAGAFEAETLGELGLSSGEVGRAQAMAMVRRVLALADGVTFEPSELEFEGEAVVSGAQVVRAAFELMGVRPGEAPFFRLVDAASLTRWELSAEEQDAMSRFTDFASAEACTARERAILELLARDGAVEWISAEEVRRREEREAEKRARAEEMREREEREAEARAREEREAEERARAEEMRQREEREAEERARVEEVRRQEAEARAREEEALRVQEQERQQAAREASERAAREADEARRRTQEEAWAEEEVILLYKSDLPPDASEADPVTAELAAPPKEPIEPQTYVGPVPSPASIPGGLQEAVLQSPSNREEDGELLTPTIRQPLVLGGPGESDEADLWQLVQPLPTASTSASGQSFEEALLSVDSTLAALVGHAPTYSGAEEPLVEPIVEAELEKPQPSTPDSSSLVQPEDLRVGDPADSADSAEAARLRRQRLLRRAMENLGSLGARESSPSQLSQAPAAESSPSSPSSSGAPFSSRPTPAPVSHETLAAQIDARFARLGGQDFFSVLGVTPSASKEEIKTAYFSLAKVYHPDRLPPSLEAYAPKMSAVFEGIREAYETLSDEMRRATWQAQREHAAKMAQPLDPAKQASDALRAADTFFKKRDYRQAEAHYAKAYALDQSAATLAAQAWAVFMDPSRKAEAPAARAMMHKALTQDPSCDRAHYQLGVIARVEGDIDAAERHFREALRINRKHLEANQELRLIEMRRKNEPPKKGLFR